MRRYLATLRLFLSTALAAEMEYRANFLMTVLSSVLMLAGTLYGLRLLFQAGYNPGGWTQAEAMLPVGLYFIIDGFAESVLRPNLSRLVEQVREGTLDFVLLKPIDPQFWLSARNCSPWGIITALCGLGVIVAGGVLRDPALPWTAYILGIVPILLALVVLYSVWFALSTLTIWLVKLYNITHALHAMLEAGKFPVAAYEPVWRAIFTFVIPVAFMTTVPAEIMLAREHGWWWLGALVLVAGGLFFAGRVFFRFALRYYTSASS